MRNIIKAFTECYYCIDNDNEEEEEEEEEMIKIKKYIMLNNRNKKIFCSYTYENTTTMWLEDMLYPFLGLNKNNYDILIQDCCKNNIKKYKYIDEIFKNVKYDKKNNIPPNYRNVFLILTYEIKENYHKTYQKIIDSIKKKYELEQTYKIKIHMPGLLTFQLDITKSFVSEEIKFLIYEKEDIKPDCQQLSKINDTEYTLRITSGYNKEMFSPLVCFNFNYDKIKNTKIDIDLDFVL